MKLLSTLVFLALLNLPILSAAPEPTSIELWNGPPPGDSAKLPPERDQTTPKDYLVGGKRLIRLENVSHPTLTIYAAEAGKATGTAVLVCPGGGYNILAYDLEGTEVCQWLNSLGITAGLLKYRVPERAKPARYTAPLQDAQRAMGLLRERANALGISPHRVGILGFSAGGSLAAIVSTHDSDRTYPKVDDADAKNSRPDFCVLIYPAYLTVPEKGDVIAPEIHVNRHTPPTFLAMAEDDPIRVENALSYYRALKNAQIPAELHLYPTGGHGYGLRRTKDLVTTWPDRAADWLKTGGWLDAK